MTDLLTHDLRDCCCHLESDKVTERKKNAEKLRSLLSKPALVALLDKNSDSRKSGRGLTWDGIFKVIRGHIQKEVESLRNAKSAVSASAQASRDKKKQDASMLFKFFVRVANKRGPRLKCIEVIHHILTIMEDPFTAKALGMDHCTILMKDILSVRTYWSDIDHKLWRDLLLLFCRTLLCPPDQFDRTLLARTLHTLMQGASVQCNIRGKNLFRFFTEYMRNARQEKNLAVLEPLVSAMNVFCKTMSADCRGQICKLGEATALGLLYVWNNRPPAQLKEEIIEFFRIQMCAHHPMGAMSDQEGEYAHDQDVWKSHLKKLYDAIYNDLEHVGGRSRFTSVTKDSALSPGFVDLAADVFHQLFLDQQPAIEVTQMTLSTQKVGRGPPAKRRRLEVGWTMVVDVLKEMRGPGLVPWLQVLTSLLQKYPRSVPADQVVPLLAALNNAQVECKKGDISSHILSCLEALVPSHQYHRGEDEDLTQVCGPLWSSVWTCTMKAVSLHHAEDQAFSLLGCLVQEKLVQPDREVWRLLCASIPSKAAVEFLAVFLSCQPLPESFTPANLPMERPSDNAPYPLRHELLRWLLPTEDVEDVDGMTSNSQKQFTSPETHTLAQVLGALVMRDHRTVISLQRKSPTKDSLSQQLQDMATLYLKSSFVIPLQETPPQGCKMVEPVASCSSLPSVLESLLAHLTRTSKQLQKVTDVKPTDTEKLVEHCTMLMKVMCFLVDRGVWKPQDVAGSTLYQDTKTALKQVTTQLSEFLKKEGEGPQAVIDSLHQLFLWDTAKESREVGQLRRAMLRAVVPNRLIDLLIDMALGKISFVRSCSSSSARPSITTTFDEDSDDFDEFDNFDSSHGNGMGRVMGSFEDFDDSPPSQQEPQSNGESTSTGTTSLLDREFLTEAHRLRVQAVQVVCAWCVTALGNSGVVNLGGAADPDLIKEKLIQEFCNEDYDKLKAVHLQLFLQVGKTLCGPDVPLYDEDVKKLILTISKTVSHYRHDQAVCSRVLPLLTCLIPRLQDCDDVATREGACTLLRAVWILQTEGQYTGPVRMAIMECMEALIKVDPCSDWSTLTLRDERRNDVPYPLSQLFPQLLRDKSHHIRIRMATACLQLFQTVHVKTNGDRCLKPADRGDQEKVFASIYEALQETMTVPGKLSADEIEDESANRVASMLATLAAVACSSAACEKRALFALFQVTRRPTQGGDDLTPDLETGEEQMEQDGNSLSNVAPELTIKVLQQIARYFGHPTCGAYLSEHLGYLVHQWLQEGYRVIDLQYTLMGYTCRRDFYRDQYSTIVPHLVMQKDMATVKHIAEELECDWVALLHSCFPRIIVNVLPLFAEQGPEEQSDRSLERVQQARECLDLIEKSIGGDSVNKLIQKHLDDIVIELLMTFHEVSKDDPDVNQFIKASDPEPNPPCFTSYTIRATMDYLTSCHASRQKTAIVLLAKSQPDSLQRILLALSTRMTKTQSIHEKRRVLGMYQLFTALLLSDLENLGGVWVFILRDVIYTLVHRLQEARRLAGSGKAEDGVELFSLSCDILYTVCQEALRCCAESIVRHLSVIVGALIPYVESPLDKGRQAVNLINFLIIDNEETLHEAISILDPLPESRSLKRAREVLHRARLQGGVVGLKEEIHHFLRAVQLSPGGGSVESFSSLRARLTKEKDQLAAISRGQQRGETDILSQLVCTLINFCCQTSSQDVSSSQDAAQNILQEEVGLCLGEIGAVDLTAIALKHGAQKTSAAKAMQVFSHDSTMQRTCVIMHLLDEYLLDEDVDVVAAAGQCLKMILSTAAGTEWYRHYKEGLKEEGTLLCYLQPFKLQKRKLPLPPVKTCIDSEFTSVFGRASLWIPEPGCHSNWITELVCSLIDSGAVQDEVLRLLTPVCKVKVDFCEQLLPFLVHSILLQGRDSVRQLLSMQLSAFFSRHCQTTETASRSATPLPTQASQVLPTKPALDQASVNTMLRVVHYLRQQERPARDSRKATPWHNNFWLDLDYLEVSKAAQTCGAYFTSLLYMEIYCEQRKAEEDSQGSQRSQASQGSQDSQGTALSSLSTLSANSSLTLQSLLMEAYCHIGEPDGVYGCGAGRLTDTSARIVTYEHEGKWDKALGAYDLQMSSPTAVIQAGVLDALKNFGCGHVLNMYLKGIRSECVADSPELREAQYQAAWRNGIWDLDVDAGVDAIPGFHQGLYTGVCSVKDRDSTLFETTVKQTRLSVVGRLASTGLESARSVYPHLVRLRCLIELQDFKTLVTDSTSCDDARQLVQKWEAQTPLLQNDFDFVEPVLALRSTLLQLAGGAGGGERGVGGGERGAVLRDALVTHLERLARCARKAARFQVAERAIHTLKQLERSESTTWSWQLEEAKLYWCRGEQGAAIHILKALISKLELEQISDDNCTATELFPQALGLNGHWLAVTQTESPYNICEDYLAKAADMMSRMEQQTPAALEAYLALARFTDQQYQVIVNYMKSSTYEAKKDMIERSRAEVEKMTQSGVVANRYFKIIKRHMVDGKDELEGLNEDRDAFLHKAMENYIRCLRAGDEHDLRVFRLCSLWFRNAHNPDINQLAKENFPKLESRKFLPLIYQLAARMGTKSQGSPDFQNTLLQLIERVATDHPYHSLYVVLALANADLDGKFIGQGKRVTKLSRSQHSQNSDVEGEEARTTVAVQVLEKVRVQKGRLVQDMQGLCEAYVQLSNLDGKAWKMENERLKRPNKLSSRESMLMKVKDLTTVAVPTVDIKVDPTCCYDDIVYIREFDPSVSFPGGINVPKVITCQGSDGVWRKQLVKGRDDLRQDAVMQQVFGLVDSLLKKDEESRRRKLTIRTYKVIPMSKQSGLVQWCEGTMSVGDYLIGTSRKPGAHVRYYPRDWQPGDCRKKIHEKGGSRSDERLRVFREVCRHFHPVMHHFFMEKWPDPMDWFERRLCYTRSVATSSIVGYVLGLGDRHCQNILIDTNTAELVHIDLGIAFEQGKLLPTPETVPFRLTRDIVHGMGVTGVEGVFRRCCEKTMEVMRSSHEALLTIVEVLLYDPLHAWTLTPMQALKLQQIDADTTGTADIFENDSGPSNENKDMSERNKVAAQVLMRLEDKLKGLEEGMVLSVSGQVNMLIQTARDPSNLSRLYSGWQAYL
uniref:non-specific serine/threonine protein kinase n=1 Tax=Branchiostoma floridae TaxID=7739 RepID=B5B307_BRAFL|nr:ataxia telangiectasia mutated protein [Branchiostoma floridae]